MCTNVSKEGKPSSDNIVLTCNTTVFQVTKKMFETLMVAGFKFCNSSDGKVFFHKAVP